METNPGPRAEYASRLESRRRDAAECDRLHYHIGNARLGLVLTAAAIAWFAFRTQAISPWWLALPVGAFVWLVAWHSRVLRKLQHVKNSIQFYERGLARLDENWGEIGEPGDRFEDPSHPYCEDLDLFGKGSLFQLLCTARTRAGEQMLAAWLKTPASSEEIGARQGAAEELRSKLDLREDLAVLGGDARGAVDSDILTNWGEDKVRLRSNWLHIAAAAIAAASVASLIYWISAGNHRWFLIMLLIELIFSFFLRHEIGHLVGRAEHAGRDLSLLSQILARLEAEHFRTPHLQKLRAALQTHEIPPSRLIARLNLLMTLLDSRRNPIFAPVAFILLWQIHLAFLIESWRKKNGRAIPGWLATVAQLEALSSVAGFAFENPDHPFPEISRESPCFEGVGLGHPLLPRSKCVLNDVRLSGELRVLLVSGSNMSGKSTLLRTVGINAVLALAGAPVRARRLRIAPLSIGASIRVMDSLQSGTSRFYAEITRLRKLVSLAEGSLPLMFLLDELLHGTNSHDRRIGAEAIIKGLVARGAIGLLTTHDLALSHIAEVLAPQAENVHFEDHIENGHMAFDYRLRAGVVRKSNALELMRSIGLEV